MAKSIYAPDKVDHALALRAAGRRVSDIEAITGVSRGALDYQRALQKAAREAAAEPRVEGPVGETPQTVWLREAGTAATAYFGEPVDVGELRRKRLGREQRYRRQFAMAWLRWKYAERLSSPRVGRLFGLNHSTVLHAEKRAREIFPDAPFSRPQLTEEEEERLEAMGLGYGQTFEADAALSAPHVRPQAETGANLE